VAELPAASLWTRWFLCQPLQRCRKVDWLLIRDKRACWSCCLCLQSYGVPALLTFLFFSPPIAPMLISSPYAQGASVPE
jgi:hypothetical protein